MTLVHKYNTKGVNTVPLRTSKAEQNLCELANQDSMTVR